MSMSVDVFMYDWSTFVDAIVDCGGYHRKVVEDVLHMYGEKICDKYVLVSDEHMLTEDPMCSISATLTYLFGIDDVDMDDVLYGVEYTRVKKGYSGSYDDEEEELKILSKRLTRK